MQTTLIKALTSKAMSPKRILGMPEDVKRVVLGTVFGIAMDGRKQTLDNGDELRGLGGQFVFASEDEAAAKSVRAGIFWPPEGFLNDILAIMEKPKSDRPDFVEFAFKFGVMRADNPAGYSYFAEPLVEAAESDPLSVLQSKLVQQGALAAPTTVAAIEGGSKAAIEDGAKGKAKA